VILKRGKLRERDLLEDLGVDGRIFNESPTGWRRELDRSGPV